MATPEAQPGAEPEDGREPSDRSLLARYRRGSQDAATQFYLRYARRLRGLAAAQMSPALAQRVELDDIVQSVFGSFFRRADTGYYDAPGGEELWQLLLVTALNKIRNQGNFHRAARRDVRRTVAGADIEGALEDAQGDDGAVAFLDIVIREAFERLPQVHQQMLELRIQGYDVAEIAQHTGRSKRTVERVMQDARKNLRSLLYEGK
jgi:RNA polymerase sigma-70 factor, ECF subfamily